MKKIGLMIVVASLVSSFLFGINTQAATFKDISNSYWAKEEIDYLYKKKIITGYPNGKFGPNDTVKRIDAASMIVRALELDTSNRPNPQFKDITRNSSGFNIVATVVDEGIFNGMDGKFQPNKSLSRAEMAAIINRAFELEKKNARVSFKDVSARFWGYEDIKALVAHNLTTGYPDNTFRPNNPTTRVEFSVFLTRVLKSIESGEEVEKPDEKENEEFEVIGIS